MGWISAEGLLLVGVVGGRLGGDREDQLAAVAGLVLRDSGNRRRERHGEQKSYRDAPGSGHVSCDASLRWCDGKDRQWFQRLSVH